MVKKLFKKECKDCEEMFRPAGRSTKYCDDCMKSRMERRTEKIKLACKTSWKNRINK